MMLLGWDAETWRRASAWAGEPSLPIYDEQNFRPLLALRRKWIDAGGPPSGPISNLVLTS